MHERKDIERLPGNTSIFSSDFSRIDFQLSIVFTYGKLSIFHVHFLRFHVCDFEEIFTHKIGISRALFKIFSRKGSHFHAKKSNFFHAHFPLFHVQKKNTECGCFF